LLARSNFETVWKRHSFFNVDHYQYARAIIHYLKGKLVTCEWFKEIDTSTCDVSLCSTFLWPRYL